MEPLPDHILDRLDFTAAAAVESQSWRNLLPPEPWLHVVETNPTSFGSYTRHRLEAGITTAPAVIVQSRKPHQQVRPVPVIGIPERISYRALTECILQDQPPLDRSQGAYRRFVGGPIKAVIGDRRTIQLGDFTEYVVESDIAAFYEYIDHAQLISELELRTSTVVLPRILGTFLNELQGRPFGLPQLLDPSDHLSEHYGRIVERELERRGMDVWRYNDDFRLTANGYDQAQAAVEALSEEARKVGLVLNEPKTHIVKFINYFWGNILEPRTDGDIEFKPEFIEVTGEYGDRDSDGAVALAHEVIDRLDTNASQPLDPRRLSRSDARDLGRAIGILTRETDPYALEKASDLFEFAAHLGHRVCTYLAALQEGGHDIARIWDELISRAHQFNAWQRIWLVYLARQGSLQRKKIRREWVASQMNDSDPLLRAEATLALAPHQGVMFEVVDHATRVEPEALLPWYALAAGHVAQGSTKRLTALKDSHRLIELVLQDP